MEQTVRLSDFFKRYRNDVITVIGSGGKTSLLWFLARCFAGDSPRLRGTGPASEKIERRILVTTTTKMGAPDCTSGLFDHFINGFSQGMGTIPPPAIEPGVTFAGNYEKGTTKTTALPPAMLSALIQTAETTLIEGDGSKTLPLKGWADYEPVVTPATTVTVGVIPLWPLGMPVTETIIHRLPLFCALTGTKRMDILTTAHIAAAISGSNRPGGDGLKRRGLFAEARGKRVLFFNQVENDNTLREAQEIMGLLPAAFKTSLNAVIAGSVKGNRITILSPNPASGRVGE